MDISVVTPAFNEERYLLGALESIQCASEHLRSRASAPTSPSLWWQVYWSPNMGTCLTLTKLDEIKDLRGESANGVG